MTSDARIVQWRERVRDQVFRIFEEHGKLSENVLIAHVKDDKVKSVFLDTNGIAAETMRLELYGIMNQFKPDAYIIAGTRNIVLFPDHEIQDRVDEYERVGSVGNMEDAKKVCVFAYETKFFSNLDVYEIIETEFGSVVNPEPMISGMDVESYNFLFGLLNPNFETQNQIQN